VFEGDHRLGTATIAVNGAVYVGSSMNTLYAVDESTGDQMWSDEVRDLARLRGAIRS